MRRGILLAAALAVHGAGGMAQPLYTEVTPTHLPAGIAGRRMNAAAADADGGGDLDVALAMEFQRKVLLVNDGRGRFTNASLLLPRAIHDSEDVAFADFDRDGDLDLVFVSEDDRKDELYLNDQRGNDQRGNDGSVRFTDASDRLVPVDVSNALVVL